MLIPFNAGLTQTSHFDPEMAALADRHYSRQSPGARQFAGNGEKIVLRDSAGLVLFVWLRQLKPRWDGRVGYNCQWFRNESRRRASEIILEAERFAVARWGRGLAFTFIDASRIRIVKRRGVAVPGFCFVAAGWKRVGISSRRRKLIFEKELA